jgi:uncharacterized protein (TIGR02246 family)
MTDLAKLRAAIEKIAEALTNAWDAGNAEAFAAQFTTDADFVNIFATHVTGRDEIEQLFDQAFETIYKGSVNKFTVEEIRALGAHAVVVHLSSHAHVPTGPLQGEVRGLATAVFTPEGHGWQIAAYQNTRVQTPPTNGEFQ